MFYGADHHAGSYKRNLHPQRLVLSDCTIHAINMIGKNHAIFLALLAIASAVASGHPARDYEYIHPSIVSKTLQSQHEKRAPQGEEQDEVYQIECRMRRMCRLAPKTSSPIQDPAAKLTSTTSIDQSILDWVSILNAPGPVMTAHDNNEQYGSRYHWRRLFSIQDHHRHSSSTVTVTAVANNSLICACSNRNFFFRGRCPPSLPKSATRYSPRHGSPDYIVCLRNKTRTTVLVAKEMPARRARGRLEEGSNEKRQAVEGFLDSNRRANSNYKHKATLMFEKVKSEK
ncbi:hypothetical protein M438DRAFT_106722 [Aureobasidium pullulans EXF-150]|uniref:Uncharacterized protein n=1 Tax=Aureobasidium pullulans EXF-150 TaxID=1043002 RepID=A0A074XFC6_AURPU|nr:uncharacterized protein M438DRAFT_106722 [Aureobasidium pullulans EXF-150]KEQ80757.1 hypothetical protein M438DRAFT_106722 [Aureobasidium pullulans EXF-150]